MCIFHSITAKKEDNESQNQTPDKIVVKNLPPSIDNQYLDMFFEYTKGQGGGPVKSVTFNRMENFAIVQFEETKGWPFNHFTLTSVLTQETHNVGSTSLQRRDVAATL